MHFSSAMLSITMAFASFFQQYTTVEWNRKSTLTTDRAIEFPGIVLAPGVYVLRILATGERRSLVEVLSRDETQVLASVVAVPDYRLRPDDNSEFTFYEVKQDGPRPVQSWFYSGDLVGLEFVYPKARAKEIAKACGKHVMASNSSKDGAIVAVTANGKEVVIDDQPVQTARRKPQ